MILSDKKTPKNNYFIFIGIVYLYLLFVNALDTHLPITKEFHLFELLYVGMLLTIFLSQTILKKELFVGDYLILGAFSILMISGLITNELLSYQGMKLALLDCVTLSKFFVAYFFGRILFEKKTVDQLLVFLQSWVRWITLFLFGALILNLVIPLWPTYETRFGYTIQILVFSHATYLTSTAIFCLLFLTFNRRKYDYIYICMNSILIILAGRNKGLIFLGVYLFVLVLQYLKKNTPIWSLIGISAILYLLFQNIISERLFSSETAARSTLYQKGLLLANDYFPFGTGFGSYGSSASTKVYSGIYGELGFNQLFGFSEETKNYLTDSFIAMILGQFGYSGLFLMVTILLSMFVLVRKNTEYESFTLLIFVFIFISMITENFISSSYGVLAFVFVGMLVNQKE
ncbi:conserved membrane hypothetical protein [Carnobacterium maltaromaticum]|uniref:hypothetical protein n=1 Tax=Carnobacterium maltaromaticum TaxID=2751 RepID=UPI00191BC00C|nr:hypothetical protein [Carnobacterium maltaromaticum]CAD5897495.1 conserved membrane hypothetical protein [Carnobacterium maltaromaticum]